MRELVKEILSKDRLAIPKDQFDLDRVKSTFGIIASETEQSWLIPCTHHIMPPATLAEIHDAEARLRFHIPAEYRRFLEFSNGASLFQTVRQLPFDRKGSVSEPIVRFHLFGCEDLVRMNARLLIDFHEMYATDPEFGEIEKLNYMAFCDALDGDFQSLLLEPTDRRVFLLFHELMYRPYSSLDAEWYYEIASSLESWFQLIIRTSGWGGRGLKRGF